MYNHHNYYDPEQSQNASDYEQESQLMIQQTDPFYQPTQKSIEEYAVQLLGMTLPQDEHLLYLSREAMMAPMPDCWETYQRANGDVYYKHKVTQQKLIEHPIEIEYRKKYMQEKEKAARKTLKSKVPLKNLSGGMGGGKVILGGLGLGSGNPLGVSSGSNSHMIGMTRGEQVQASIRNDSQLYNYDFRDDTQIFKKYDKQIEELEQNLKRKYNNLKKSEEDSYNDFERRSRNNHNDELDRLRREGLNQISLEERLRNEKKRISSELDHDYEKMLKKQKISVEQNFERNLKNSEIQIEAGFNKKLFDDEAQIQRKLESKSKRLQEYKSEIETEKHNMQLKYNTELQQNKKSLINSKSIHINQQLQNRIKKITQEIQTRIKQKQMSFEEQFNKISKAIKGSPENRIQEIMREKLNLQEISNKKVEMQKIKQKKTIEQEISIELLEEKKKVRKRVEAKIQSESKDLSDRLEIDESREIDRKKKEYQRKWNDLEKSIYEKFKDKIQEFELKKNKNLTTIRQSFIRQIEDKTQHLEIQSHLNATKLQITQKKFEIDNKLKQIESIKKEIAYVHLKLQRVNFNSKIYRARGSQQVNSLLRKYLESKKVEFRELAGESDLQINMINEVVSERHVQLKEAKKQLESDKSLLLRVFKHLQSNTVLPSYEKKKAADSMSYSTKIQHMGFATSQLLKKYNKDVRLMRQNARSIQQLQNLIKKAEINDQYLEKLQQFELNYAIPQLREELSGFGFQDLQRGDDIGEKTVIGNGGINLKEIGGHNTDLISTKKVRQIFNDHSRFLSGVKNQLNHKLAQIRGMSQLY